jgi:putative ABC transport system permease protein
MSFRRREEIIDRELRDYLERETADNIARGMSPADARQAAQRKLGSALRAKEEARAAYGMAALESLAQDVRHGVRMFLKNRMFTAVAVVSLALGTGANCAMFSAVDALLLRPLPVAHAGDIVTVGSLNARGPYRWLVASFPDYVEIRARAGSFDGMASYANVVAAVAVAPGSTPRVRTGCVVSGDFFSVLGVEPELGRAFRPDEDQTPNRDRVAVLSHGMWAEQFASDPAVVGRIVRIANQDFRVIGVAPPSFTGMDAFFRPSFYVPNAMWPLFDPAALTARDHRGLTLKARMRPGITMAGAQAELAGIGRQLASAHPDTNRHVSLLVESEWESRIGRNSIDTALLGLLATLSTAVLMVACFNVAGLLSSRGPVRAREIAVRLSIGASRARLVRQLIVESLLIAVVGALLGLVVGYIGVRLFGQVHFPTDIVAVPEIVLDMRAMAFNLVAAVCCAFAFGLAPALQTTRTDLAGSLKTQSTESALGRRTWGRNLLVCGQVAISLVLLTLAVFAHHAFSADLSRGMGFRTERLLLMHFDPRLIGYSRAGTRAFYDRLIDEVRNTPGVKSASLASTIPLSSQEWAPIVPEGYRFTNSQTHANPYIDRVDESFFDTFGVAIVRGRPFLRSDGAGAPRVAIVNEVFAERYWPGESAVGKRVRFDETGAPWVEIVGVAKSGRYLHIAETPGEFIYFPYQQMPREAMILLAQTTADSGGVATPLRRAVAAIDRNMPIYDVRTIENHYWAMAAGMSGIISGIIALMGVMGMGLSMVGLYGLISYSVSRRTREIGIRIAIGAGRGAVLRMVMRQGLRLALYGVAAGLALSEGASLILPSVFPIEARLGMDTLLIVTPMLLAITMLAALIPARRAAAVNPVTALRYD